MPTPIVSRMNVFAWRNRVVGQIFVPCSKGVARKALGRDRMVHAALRETADHTRYLGAITRS
jgi:hypothetical protein